MNRREFSALCGVAALGGCVSSRDDLLYVSMSNYTNQYREVVLRIEFEDGDAPVETFAVDLGANGGWETDLDAPGEYTFTASNDDVTESERLSVSRQEAVFVVIKSDEIRIYLTGP